MPKGRRLWVAVTVAIVFAPMTVLSPAVAAPVTYRFDGGGYGHGIGMSQWGSKGMAEQGYSAAQILTHYYQGTSVVPVTMRPYIRVGVLQGVGQMTIRSAGAIAGDGHLTISWSTGSRTILQGEAWQIRAEGDLWRLYKNGAIETGTFGGALTVTFGTLNSLLKIDETGNRYRWGFLDLVHRTGSATFDAVIDIGSYEAYLYGLGEVPSSWPMAALQTQAIAARTYALEKAKRLGDRRIGCVCTVYASTLDQAYVGYEKEAGPSGSRWVSAVDGTAGQAVTLGGAPVQTYYSSSSGGHTENNEFVWGGSPISYLRGVPDQGDSTTGNSNFRWSHTYTAEQLSNALNSNALTSVGSVINVEVLPPFGVSGRVGSVINSNEGGVRLVGTSGTKRVSGSLLQGVLGFKSTLYTVSKTQSHPDGTFLKGSGPAVWLLKDGIRWPVASGEAYVSRASWSEFVTVSDEVIASYPAAGLGWREGVLLGTPDGAIYLVSDGVRRHITSPTTFAGLGLSFANVRNVSELGASVHRKGAPITSSVIVPDGVFVKTSSSPNVYLVVDGAARHIPTEAVFLSYRTEWNEISSITQQQLTALGGPGSAIGFRNGLLILTPDSKVSAISDGARRHIPSESLFLSLGYEFADVVTVSEAEAALHSEGSPVTSDIHPNGTLLKSSGPAIWMLRDGVLWPVASADAFITRAFWSEIVTPSDSQLASYPNLGIGWRDGVLLDVGGAVYIVSNGLRRHIVSPEVFEGLGLSWSNIMAVGNAAAAVHPLGSPVTGAAVPVDGMFVKKADSTAVYLIVNGNARWVVSEMAFNSYHAAPAEIATITAGQLAAVPAGPGAGFRDGILISTSDGKVWAISDGRRRWITSPAAFLALGYEFADILSITDAEAQVHPEGEPIGS